MKLMRIGEPGSERPAILDDRGEARDLSSFVADINGKTISREGIASLAGIDLARLPVVERPYRYGPCVSQPSKFVCIGLNYADHAAETNAPIPDEPVVFMKVCGVSGANDPIIQPRNSEKLDWEVELALVIGEHCLYADDEQARRAIAGYFICNDVSERSFQLERGGQWDKGKGCDSFGPIGPWLVTADEVTDPCDLDMWLEVNGRRFQDGSTRTMIFSPAFIVSYLSQFMSLNPGDVITTGTPPGVGLGQTPPIYLKAGDVVRLGITGLGEQRQIVVASA